MSRSLPGFIVRASIILLVLLVLPSAVFAQAAITGVVKDASGGVLPGVTVEAASPVLIEKVRSVVTDDTGQYRIVALRPGTYSVTFSYNNTFVPGGQWLVPQSILAARYAKVGVQFDF